jgi:hypothetical protein
MRALKSLPARPSLESLRKHAKKLARDTAAGDAGAIARARAQVPIPLEQHRTGLGALRQAGRADGSVAGGGGTTAGVYRFFDTGPFRATAALTSFLNAPVSSCSPSWMSIARLVLPSRLELKRRDRGS